MVQTEKCITVQTEQSVIVHTDRCITVQTKQYITMQIDTAVYSCAKFPSILDFTFEEELSYGLFC